LPRKKNANVVGPSPAVAVTSPAERPVVRRLLDKTTVTDVTGKSYPWIWTEMRAGRFPRSVVIGGSSKWFEDEIAAYIESLPRRRLKGDEAA
jgi:predicted DNA-binding transcriptional regulator AlpA